MASNLPPGVNDNMIPGNRPEDLREEKFFEDHAERCAKEGITLDEDWESERAGRIFTIARDLGYDEGYQDACAESDLAQMYIEEWNSRMLNYLERRSVFFDDPQARELFFSFPGKKEASGD